MPDSDQGAKKKHVTACLHYSIHEPFQRLVKGDLIFDKGFLHWKNWFTFLRGEVDAPAKKPDYSLK